MSYTRAAITYAHPGLEICKSGYPDDIHRTNLICCLVFLVLVKHVFNFLVVLVLSVTGVHS